MRISAFVLRDTQFVSLQYNITTVIVKHKATGRFPYFAIVKATVKLLIKLVKNKF